MSVSICLPPTLTFYLVSLLHIHNIQQNVAFQCKFDCPCTNDSECCSGWCHASICQPSSIGSFCSLKKKHGCFDQLGCTEIYRYNDIRWKKQMRLCENCTKLGSPCTNATFCCGVGHWPGGYGNCLNNICDCKVNETCQSNSECCSNDCYNNKCMRGNFLDVCIADSLKQFGSCRREFVCVPPSYNLLVSQHFQNTRGTCADYLFCGNQIIEPHFGTTSTSHIVKKIVNGEFAKRNSWPYMLSVRSPHFCGAVLIHRRYALTAAHCLDPQHMSANQEIKVALASHLTDDPHSQIVSVSRFVRYPAYRYNRDNDENDIAILQFPKTIKFSRKLIPICLAERTFPAGYECVAAGWGHINSSREYSNIPLAPSMLRQVKVRLLTNGSRCNVDGMVCTDARISYGDSGGPLMCQRSGGQWELHGIVTGMIPGYTRYASTVYHKEWIAQQIQKLDWELL